MSRQISFIALFLSCIVASVAHAESGDPVALIRLPGGGIKVESMGGLSVVLARDVQSAAVTLPSVILVHSAADQKVDSPHVLLQIDGQLNLNHVWDRMPNADTPTWKPATENVQPSDNAFLVQGASEFGLIEVDGVRIAIVSSAKLGKERLDKIRHCDALVAFGTEAQETLKLAKQAAAKRLVVGPEMKIDGATTWAGNTMPLSAKATQEAEVQVITLGEESVVLSNEITDLIERKEASCRASQKVFAELSVQQMNFRPANGSHTPRWNAEHMMGRELLFFSQIFHAKDATIPVIDLNPKQMPPDYQAKHPDWTGAEEARQMERVTAYVRRYSYLLKDMPLDEKAPSSRWAPRGLLKQMDRHYSEHTANVKLKFKLPGWPQK
ncbi:DinB family protein [Stieleria marina]|uniref:DinB-like domain-containing protein n=1 Tax=Stieleria marina TaxID=1930275 RepID=A0A517NPV0_9BACT|nr:hypothetical protein K239x_10820 [Planctomycetes bacterium K23_9]